LKPDFVCVTPERLARPCIREEARMPPTIVEVLVIPGCGDIDLVLERVHAAVERHGGEWVLRIRQVEDPVASRFLGCPSVRVDGQDVESGANARVDFVLRCREYAVGGAIEHAPPVEWIACALEHSQAYLSEAT
jgi:hypothetical protein